MKSLSRTNKNSKNAAKSAPAKPAVVAAPAVPDVAPQAAEVAQAAAVPLDAAEAAPVARKPRKPVNPEVTELKIALLEIDGGTQSRASLNKQTIGEYGEQMTSGAKFPPVVAFFDGESHWLADGFHRVHASIAIGRKKIACEIHEGSRRDAILFAASCNAAHGLRRSAADKAHTVRLLLSDKEWASASDRWIAEKAGVGHPFVAKVRSQLESDSSSPAAAGPSQLESDSSSAPRLGKDGKVRKGKAKPSELARMPGDALGALQTDVERHMLAWGGVPENFALALEALAAKARAHFTVTEAANG